jgi:predicted glycogen debranching enzyme
MGYLKFDKNQLVNLSYSLGKEILRTNRAGAFACSTIVGCNTRKYHGLLIAPVEEMEGKYVFLSALDVTVIQHDAEFNLGIHKYPNDKYFPKGHKYIVDYNVDNVSSVTYRVGGVILVREFILSSDNDQIIMKYTLVDAHSDTLLRFRPFLAFRNMHQLSHANMDANTRVDAVPNGVKSRMYAGFPSLYMQFSKKNEFVPVPDWYYNVEYVEEKLRGYDCNEDLFVPGYFEMPIKKGESIYFSASLSEATPSGLSRKFLAEIDKRVSRSSYKNCLINAAQQFIEKRGKKTYIVAGFPWFDSWGRDTFISLPGLTLALGDEKTFKAVIDTQISRLKDGLFPNVGTESGPAFNSVDAPLWFFWSLQQYVKHTGKTTEVWEKYSKAMKSILCTYRDGGAFNIHKLDNGLIWAGEKGKALTWMDAVVEGKPVTPRFGMPVEINALWYNAVCFALSLAKESGDDKFILEWSELPDLIKESFIAHFWDEQKQYLADYIGENGADWTVRPNQIIAAALEFSPLTNPMKKAIIDVVNSELLTPKGLRTLSPKHPLYRGTYEGDQLSRDNAYHQGTVWPWLSQFYAAACLSLFKKTAYSTLKELYYNFEPDMHEYGIGTVAEIYDGDPPHQARGAISQAWSVASVLAIGYELEKAGEIKQ